MRRFSIALTIVLIAAGSSRAEHNTSPRYQYSPLPIDPGCPTPYPTTPQTPSTPGQTPSTQPAPTAPQTPAPANPDTAFPSLTSAALGDSSFAMTAPGYLDPAAPANVFRLRYDSEYHITRPDRAEFFYAKCGCFPGAPGVPDMESGINSQELQAYLEYAPSCRWSVFVEMPYRIINPEANDNANGIGDIRYGAKAALYRDQDQILSLQVKGYSPTGNARLGLGNDHWTVEPSFLYWGQLNEKIQIYGQAGIWVPIGGTEFAGNIAEYGVGLSYTLIDGGKWRLCPIIEALGWTCLDGQEYTGLDSPANTTFDAAGKTIINLKAGARYETDRHSLYVGYGHAVTGEFWYRDILRVEYRLNY